MDDVADLILTPFHDIVDKGRTAVENAGDTQPMLKAAQNLVKEGERALKRIEPLCKKRLDEFGVNFLSALKENDDIANYRSELTDLLWEFDDFVEVDDFDADKFAELQGLSRKAAPKIYDILMRMNLEPPPRDDFSQVSTPISPPRTHPLAPIIAEPIAPGHPRPSDAFDARGSILGVEAATDQLKELMQTQSGPDEGLDGRQHEPGIAPESVPAPEPQVDTEIPPEPEAQPPPPPVLNPWDVKFAPASAENRLPDDILVERRPPISASGDSISDAHSPLSVATDPNDRRPSSTVLPQPLNLNLYVPDTPGSDDGDNHRRSISPRNSVSPQTYPEHSYSLFPTHSPRARAPTLGSPYPGDDVAVVSPLNVGAPVPRARFSQASNHSQVTSNPESFGSDPILATELHRPDTNASELRTPATVYSETALSTSPVMGRLSPSLDAATTSSHAGLEVAGNSFHPDVENGLIPVESENVAQGPPLHMPQGDCTIRSSSSFYMAKGFCEGAREVVMGGIGIKKSKRPGFATSTTVAKCKTCLYELDFYHIERDIGREDRGTSVLSGVAYRLRFLQKSHIYAKRIDDIQYGCIFCVHEGHTTEESDATVFFSPKALMSHIARHPRPLPAVSGITVVDQVEVPDKLRNDFDIHLMNPPVTNAAREKAAEIASLPRGVTREQARRMYGQRLLQDKTPAHQLAAGAKLTGIVWPSKHLGEWVMTWHDGVYASIPMDLVRLEQPPPHMIKIGGTSRIRAKARWKFPPKEKEKGGNWLKFEKNETITNISWPHPDHWCWSGTNAKGKWGIFPQVYLDSNTVQELTPDASDRASILSNEKTKSSSFIGRLASRKASSARPPSFSESRNVQGASPHAYMYRGGNMNEAYSAG